MDLSKQIAVFCSTITLLALIAPSVWAIPQFSRSTGADCVDCHVSPPKLNEYGKAFMERHYRLPGDAEMDSTVVPMSMWMTGRSQAHPDLEEVRNFLHRVEPVSGRDIGDLPMSYFFEWRPVSLGLQPDGTYQDRSGRFEDLFVRWEFIDDHEVEVGQFRASEQVDASRRLSVSEPSILSSSLPGRPADDARRESVRGFSPSGRSPSIRYIWHSIEGEHSPADGLFHMFTLAFPGEFSIPLTSDAREHASFEFEPRPKGVFAETIYRSGLNSIGIHSFVGDASRWMVSGIGTFNVHDLMVTAGLGRDSGTGEGQRTRMSLENEYWMRWHPRLRGALGIRAEHITNDGNAPSYIPYLSVAGPNTFFSFVLQAEYRIEQDEDFVFVDLSTMF